MDDLVNYLQKHNLTNWAAMVAHLSKEHYEMSEQMEGLQKRVTDAEAGNELDRSRVARAITDLHAAIRSRDWVLEGRGPYEWDDDDYRAEFGLWVDDVNEAAKLFAIIASDWHGCPIDRDEIRHARAMLAPTKE